MKKEFELTDEQFENLLKACEPIPLIAINCGLPPSPQEMANNAWKRLGDELGFLWDTVQPVSGKAERFFTAEIKG